MPARESVTDRTAVGVAVPFATSADSLGGSVCALHQHRPTSLSESLFRAGVTVSRLRFGIMGEIFCRQFFVGESGRKIVASHLEANRFCSGPVGPTEPTVSELSPCGLTPTLIRPIYCANGLGIPGRRRASVNTGAFRFSRPGKSSIPSLRFGHQDCGRTSLPRCHRLGSAAPVAASFGQRDAPPSQRVATRTNCIACARR